MLRQRLPLCLFLLVAAIVSAQERPSSPPTFRGGANLVHVDVYATANGKPVTDLRAEDFEVLEDDRPQRVESFELIRGSQAASPEPATADGAGDASAKADGRVFVLFMDTWHAQAPGAYKADNPIARLLDRVIGADDLVGVMTPEMSARNLHLSPRSASIEDVLRANWIWGERGQLNASDPREAHIEQCYPDTPESAGVAAEMIARRREQKTLDALEDLIEHLADLREERKFVLVLTEGWALFARDEKLARVLAPRGDGQQAGGDGAGDAKAAPKRFRRDPNRNQGYDSCERERAMLAFADHQLAFRRMLQLANRANVSFYPIDPREAAVRDAAKKPAKKKDEPAATAVETERLEAREKALDELAANTDGFRVAAASGLERATARMVADIQPYYLLSYYSTNTNLDGKFRRLTVRVKRPGVELRTRPGYLAPRESDLASARVEALMNGAPPGYTTQPPSAAIARALSGVRTLRGVVPFRAEATGGPGFIWFTGEIDASTLKRPEWQEGGTARITIEHERGDLNPLVAEIPIEPGQRTFSLTRPEGERLAPGRYVVRVQLSPKGTAVPLLTTVDAIVPREDALMGTSAVVFRRGPTTGLQYARTADDRFRRTERIRLEIPRFADQATLEARLMNKEGQVLAVPVTLSERTDDTNRLRFIVADLSLAPLAQGEYAVDVEATGAGRTERVTYEFRLIP